MIPVFEWVRVTEIRELAEKTYVIGFEEPRSAAQLLPGQFCMISPAPGTSSVYIPRPFSYYRTSGNRIEILFRTFGRATRWMAHLSAGDRIGVFGPLGNAFSLQPQSARAILAGGGIGLPPLALLAGRLAEADTALEVDLVYGETEGSRVVNLEGVLPGTVRLHLATEDGAVGRKGQVTDLLSDLIASCDGRPALYTCGPKAMLAAVSRMIDPARVTLFEASCEEHMACGKGICQGCVIPVKAPGNQTRYVRCCTEGPVFNGFEVKWETG